ncbi:hypothetical protein NP544_28545 [Pseudomonas monteilii]|nr:hypothetical protein [Pseudomonas monteilii]MDD2127495.1 hypothetical protein [Pseudomonas monteilii]
MAESVTFKNHVWDVAATSHYELYDQPEATGQVPLFNKHLGA